MEWQSRWHLVGARLTIASTLAVAVLSVLTGVANIGTEAVAGPLAPYVPLWASRTAGFTGTLTGFLMLGGALALRSGLRAGWYATVLFLPLTALQGLLQTSPYSVPLVALSLVALPVVALNRGRFARRVDLSTTQLASLTALVGSLVYGTVGSYALRAEFGGIESLTDALYFAIVTASTVGYGDITPQTPMARLFGISMLLVALPSFAVALGVLLGPAIEDRLTRALGRMTETQLDLLEDHILVLGYGDLTEPMLEELFGQTEVVVVTTDADRATELRDHDYNVLVADPSDEEPLRRAGIDRARAVVVATNDDAEDALAVLTASQLNVDIPIVAAATNRENVEKLRRAGADTVISPATIGGKLLVQSALGYEGMEEVADRVIDEAENADETDGDGG